MGGPASFHRPSDIPAAAGRSKDLRPSRRVFQGVFTLLGASVHPLLPPRKPLRPENSAHTDRCASFLSPYCYLRHFCQSPYWEAGLLLLPPNACVISRRAELQSQGSKAKATLFCRQEGRWNFPSLFKEDEAHNSSYEVFKHEVPPLYPSPLSQHGMVILSRTEKLRGQG